MRPPRFLPSLTLPFFGLPLVQRPLITRILSSRPLFTRSFFAVARLWRTFVAFPIAARPRMARRLPGFLSLNRKRLALIALVSATFMLSSPLLPAEAGIVQAEVVIADLQTFTASPAVVDIAPVRENFTITHYSAVQYPTAMGSISSGFGYRNSPCRGCSSNHEGVDITPGYGAPVLAIAEGVVTAAGWSGGYGMQVAIAHVVDGVAVTSVYGHMQGGSLAVGVGNYVAMGQQVGLVGNTGSSTGAHLHFEIRVDGGRAIEPLGWMSQHVNS